MQDQTLQSQGAVSEATVLEMVAGVRQLLQTDYAIAISGIMGPGGGSQKNLLARCGLQWPTRQQHGRKNFIFGTIAVEI